jgi:hypothetical protein
MRQIISKVLTTYLSRCSLGQLDKEATSDDDIFDAFRIALQFYH